jgi:hypothetical protein
MANWTTTMVIVSTKAASDTIDAAIVVKIPKAASGPPVIQRGTTSKSSSRSMVIVAADRTRPASTHMTGMNHRLDRTREGRDEPLTTAEPKDQPIWTPSGDDPESQPPPETKSVGRKPRGDGATLPVVRFDDPIEPDDQARASPATNHVVELNRRRPPVDAVPGAQLLSRRAR